MIPAIYITTRAMVSGKRAVIPGGSPAVAAASACPGRMLDKLAVV
jgi:hypothetical protein